LGLGLNTGRLAIISDDLNWRGLDRGDLDECGLSNQHFSDLRFYGNHFFAFSPVDHRGHYYSRNSRRFALFHVNYLSFGCLDPRLSEIFDRWFDYRQSFTDRRHRDWRHDRPQFPFQHFQPRAGGHRGLGLFNTCGLSHCWPDHCAQFPL
jgi:hypothetical protein